MMGTTRMGPSGGLCQYCGSLAQEYDHIEGRKKLFRGFLVPTHHRPTKVPCCRSCNINLQDCPCTDVRSRAGYLFAKLAGKASEERLSWLRDVAIIDDENVPITFAQGD